MEPRLIDVEYRYQDPRTGTWHPVRAEDLPQFRAARYRIQSRAFYNWEDSVHES